MSTTTNTPPEIGLRWTEIADAHAAYDTLANNPTWEVDPSNVQAELTAAYELARLYDALSATMTGPLATAVRHARHYLDHQITELEDAIDEELDEECGEYGEDVETDEQGVDAVVSAIRQMIHTHGVEFFDESLSYDEFEKAWKQAGGPNE